MQAAIVHKCGVWYPMAPDHVVLARAEEVVEGQAGARCSPPLFKRPVRAARRTMSDMEGSDEEEEDPEEQPVQYISGNQVARDINNNHKSFLASRAAQEGSGTKGPYDASTWNMLLELGYAPTPAQGQHGTMRTPREFNPAAATPPLVHTDTLAGKRTPPSGPQGATPPLPLVSAAKMLSSRTPTFARKRSVADEFDAAGAVSRARPAGRDDASAQQASELADSAAEPVDGMAVLAAAAADSEERSDRQQLERRQQQEPFTPTSSAKRRALAGPDRDALDGLVRPLLFTSPLLSLSTPATAATPAGASPGVASAEPPNPMPRHSPLVLRTALHLVPPVLFPESCVGAEPCSQAAPLPEVRHMSVRNCTWAGSRTT